MADAFFTIANGSRVTTTEGVGLGALTSLRIRMDVAFVDTTPGFDQMPVDNGTVNGQSLRLTAAGELQLLPNATAGALSNALPSLLGARNIWLATFDGTDQFVYQLGEIGLGSPVQAVTPTAAVGGLFVGARSSGTEPASGDYYKVEIGSNAPEVIGATLDASDTDAVEGPLANLSTFMSGGIEWSVSGNDVSFTAAVPEESGSFALEGTAELGFAGFEIENFFGAFALETETALGFTGVGLPNEEGDFALEAEALLGFVGENYYTGAFGLVAEAELGFAGVSSAEGEFALEGEAHLGFAGVATHFGEFHLEATANIDMIWMPQFCPGTSAVGCAVGPATVTDTLYPASACTCNKEGC